MAAGRGPVAPEHTACGFVLACTKGGIRRYLLLRAASHGNWGFPKGHMDPGETHLQTARRETEEEAGIAAVRVVDGFGVVDRYSVNTPKRGAYVKEARYFLGLVDECRHTLSEEHSEGGWFTLQEALSRLTFDFLKQTLRQADEHLRRFESQG